MKQYLVGKVKGEELGDLFGSIIENREDNSLGPCIVMFLFLTFVVVYWTYGFGFIFDAAIDYVVPESIYEIMPEAVREVMPDAILEIAKTDLKEMLKSDL